MAFEQCLCSTSPLFLSGRMMASLTTLSHTLPTENLLEDTDGLLRPLTQGGEAPHQ